MTGKTVFAGALTSLRTVLLGNGTSKGALIAFEFILAGYLGAAGFGHYAIVLSVVQILLCICVLGMNFGAVQYVAIYMQENNLTKRNSTICMALASVALCAAITAIALFLARNYLANDLFEKPDLAAIFAIAAPLVFLDALALVIAAIFRGLGQFTRNVLAFDLLRNAASLAGVIFVVFFDGGLAAALMVCIFGSAAGVIYGLTQLARQRMLVWSVDRDVLEKLLSFLKLLFFWNLLQVLAVRFFIVAAGIFLTSAETGALAVATRLALAFIFFQTAVGAISHPAFAQYHQKNDTTAARGLYQTMSRGLMAAVGGIALFILIDPAFVAGLFGEGYAAYGWICWPLLAAHLFNVVTGPAGTALLAHARQRLLMGLTVFDVGMQFLVVVPMIAFYGVAGAVVGETARLVFFVFLRLWFLKRDLDISPFNRDFLKVSGIFAVSLGAGLLLTSFSGTYAIAITAALAVYTAGVGYTVYRDPVLQSEILALIRQRSKRDTSQ